MSFIGPMEDDKDLKYYKNAVKLLRTPLDKVNLTTSPKTKVQDKLSIIKTDPDIANKKNDYFQDWDEHLSEIKTLFSVALGLEGKRLIKIDLEQSCSTRSSSVESQSCDAFMTNWFNFLESVNRRDDLLKGLWMEEQLLIEELRLKEEEFVVKKKAEELVPTKTLKVEHQGPSRGSHIRGNPILNQPANPLINQSQIKKRGDGEKLTNKAANPLTNQGQIKKRGDGEKSWWDSWW